MALVGFVCLCLFFKREGTGRGSRLGAEAHCPEVWDVSVITEDKPGKGRWQAACVCELSPAWASLPLAANAYKPRQGPLRDTSLAHGSLGAELIRKG